MRCSITAALAVSAALVGGSKAWSKDWVEARVMSPDQLSVLCTGRAGLRLLARTQITTSGDETWKSLARAGYVIERIGLGEAPLDPGKCFVIVRAGSEVAHRRAFEVRDFIVGEGEVEILLLGAQFPVADSSLPK